MSSAFRFEPWAPRSVRFLELWKHGGWRLKVYGIAYRGDRPSHALVSAAKEVAEAHLPTPASTDRRYGVGFLGVHEGRDGNLVFVDWWADENELHHLPFVAFPERPTALAPAGPEGPMACVWDLALVEHERRAWIDAALSGHGTPDLSRYLATRLDRVV
jgi:hypothetical protein